MPGTLRQRLRRVESVAAWVEEIQPIAEDAEPQGFPTPARVEVTLAEGGLLYIAYNVLLGSVGPSTTLNGLYLDGEQLGAAAAGATPELYDRTASEAADLAELEGEDFQWRTLVSAPSEESLLTSSSWATRGITGSLIDGTTVVVKADGGPHVLEARSCADSPDTYAANVRLHAWVTG